jgi:hypothetical protein
VYRRVIINGFTPRSLIPRELAQHGFCLGLAGADLISQWIGMVEYIHCYSAPELLCGLLPATRLASREILTEQNIKKRTGPSLCLLCDFMYQKSLR